jgi:hypothetical protein
MFFVSHFLSIAVVEKRKYQANSQSLCWERAVHLYASDSLSDEKRKTEMRSEESHYSPYINSS